MFDFNCDVAQNNNAEELEIRVFASSINIASGVFGKDITKIVEGIKFASENEKSVGACVECDKTDMTDEEIEALVIYQVGAIYAAAKVFGVDMEYVRCCGEMSERLNNDIEFAKKVANAVKHINPWLTLIVGSYDTKKILEEELRIKCAYEVTFTSKSSIRELREMENKPDTVHFTTLDDIKRAYDVIKPSPINYNRVAMEI